MIVLHQTLDKVVICRQICWHHNNIGRWAHRIWSKPKGFLESSFGNFSKLQHDMSSCLLLHQCSTLCYTVHWKPCSKRINGIKAAVCMIWKVTWFDLFYVCVFHINNISCTLYNFSENIWCDIITRSSFKWTQ